MTVQKKSRTFWGFLSTSLNHQNLLWFCLNCRVPSLGTASHRPGDVLEQLGFLSVYKPDNQGMEDGAHPSPIFSSNQNVASKGQNHAVPQRLTTFVLQ